MEREERRIGSRGKRRNEGRRRENCERKREENKKGEEFARESLIACKEKRKKRRKK